MLLDIGTDPYLGTLPDLGLVMTRGRYVIDATTILKSIFSLGDTTGGFRKSKVK